MIEDEADSSPLRKLLSIRTIASLCALALAATGVAGLGLREDGNHAAAITQPAAVTRPLSARAQAAIVVAIPVEPIYIVSTQEQAEYLVQILGNGAGLNTVLAVTREGERLIDSQAAGWGGYANRRVVDLRAGVESYLANLGQRGY